MVTDQSPARELDTSAGFNNTAAVLFQLTAIAWLLAKLIGWKLWIKDRLFPLAPVADWMNWPSAVHYSLLVISLALLIFLCFVPHQKKILAGLIVVELLACVADQNRWQPWEYQYLFTAIIILYCNNDGRKAMLLVACMLAGTYCYSGLGKFNEGFLIVVWEDLVLRKTLHLKDAAMQTPWIHYSGYATAALELLAGIGLLIPIFRKAAAYCIIGMHLLLLALLGPFGLRYNIVVWPWNLLMIGMVYIAFIYNGQWQLNGRYLWSGVGKWVVLCWGVLPALNFAGRWDHYLSVSLYSGKVPQMAICLTNSNVPAAMTPYIRQSDPFHCCDGKAFINLQTWALQEMKVPPYPELRVFHAVEKAWRQRYPTTNITSVYFRYCGTKKICVITDPVGD